MTDKKDSWGSAWPEGWMPAVPIKVSEWPNAQADNKIKETWDANLTKWSDCERVENFNIIPNAQPQNKFAKAQKHYNEIMSEGATVQYEKVTLTIPVIDSWPLDIKDAIKVGDLAVYPETKIGSFQSRVCHIPTLSRFDKAVPHDLSDEDLPQWCALIQEKLKDDWKLLSLLTNETYDGTAKHLVECKERIMQMCLRTRL